MDTNVTGRGRGIWSECLDGESSPPLHIKESNIMSFKTVMGLVLEKTKFYAEIGSFN